MAEAQDNMTPEEKLLNVIQSGGEEVVAPEEKLAAAVVAPAEPEAAPEPVEAPAPVPVAEEVAQVAEKPALKLAAKDQKAQPTAEKKAEVAAPAAEADSESPQPAVKPLQALAFSKKKSNVSSGVKTINRMLAAGILILLSLSGFETFRVIRARGVVRKLASLQIPAADELTITAADVQRAYSVDPWWQDPGTIVRAPDNTQEGPRAPSAPWTEEMKNYKLMGVSLREPKADSEAILVDTRDNRMYFVRLGDSVPVSGVEVKLDDLEAQRARFTDGRASIELK